MSNESRNRIELPSQQPAVPTESVSPARYPVWKSRTVPTPSELAKVPSPNAFCQSQLCLEIKYNLPYYLRKADLMRHLRGQHDKWWGKYTELYERSAFTYPTPRTGSGWDYTNAAKGMLSRCKLYDSLFTAVLKLDITHVDDFGTYCRMVFVELNKLKPAFPQASSSQAVFEDAVKDLMKFILRQAPEDYDVSTVPPPPNFAD